VGLQEHHVEEGEFAQFIAHVKGKDLASVRREIDEEIRTLREQRKVAMRDYYRTDGSRGSMRHSR